MTADVAFCAPLTESSAYKITDLPGSRASVRVAFSVSVQTLTMAMFMRIGRNFESPFAHLLKCHFGHFEMVIRIIIIVVVVVSRQVSSVTGYWKGLSSVITVKS